MRQQTKQLRMPDSELSIAAYAWEMGGSMALGLWFVRHKELCGNDYGALVRAVREYLQDWTDYSIDITTDAGCVSAVGANRISATTKPKDDEEE